MDAIDCKTSPSAPSNETLPARRGRGRPAIITLELVQEVARLIAKGMTEQQACIRVGINHDSFRTARHRYPEFETAVKEAQADYLDESLDIIGKGGRGCHSHRDYDTYDPLNQRCYG